VTTIAEPPTPTRIVFGTDGWRARVADEFTFENVRRCTDGVARYVVERGESAKGVVVAYDRRFASEHFAMAAAEVLLAHDIPVFFAERAVPPDRLVRLVERGGAAGTHGQPQPGRTTVVKALTGPPARRSRSSDDLPERHRAATSPTPKGWFDASTVPRLKVRPGRST
jgi:hypothetical protein